VFGNSSQTRQLIIPLHIPTKHDLPFYSTHLNRSSGHFPSPRIVILKEQKGVRAEHCACFCRRPTDSKDSASEWDNGLPALRLRDDVVNGANVLACQQKGRSAQVLFQTTQLRAYRGHPDSKGKDRLVRARHGETL
jgi:hypothetical protein